jgi:hypothetical protein
VTTFASVLNSPAEQRAIETELILTLDATLVGGSHRWGEAGNGGTPGGVLARSPGYSPLPPASAATSGGATAPGTPPGEGRTVPAPPEELPLWENAA